MMHPARSCWEACWAAPQETLFYLDQLGLEASTVKQVRIAWDEIRIPIAVQYTASSMLLNCRSPVSFSGGAGETGRLEQPRRDPGRTSAVLQRP